MIKVIFSNNEELVKNFYYSIKDSYTKYKLLIFKGNN